jgi:CheY-like chemotaxis protein
MHATLVVDDCDDIRSLLGQFLNAEGHNTLQAENGKIAQKKLMTGERPCLIFLDLMMPVMDGNQFLAWKNNQPEYAEIPVVIISALAPKDNLPGTKGYLVKPFDLKELVKYVVEYC